MRRYETSNYEIERALYVMLSRYPVQYQQTEGKRLYVLATADGHNATYVDASGLLELARSRVYWIAAN